MFHVTPFNIIPGKPPVMETLELHKELNQWFKLIPERRSSHVSDECPLLPTQPPGDPHQRISLLLRSQFNNDSIISVVESPSSMPALSLYLIDVYYVEYRNYLNR